MEEPRGGSDDLKGKDEIAAKAEAGGYHGVVASRSTSGGANTTKEQVVEIDTILCAADDQKPLWAARTKVDDPASLLEVIESIVKTAVEGLKKAKLIQ